MSEPDSLDLDSESFRTLDSIVLPEAHGRAGARSGGARSGGARDEDLEAALGGDTVDSSADPAGDSLDSFEISLVAEGDRSLGRYELVYEIGRGGMASVFLARTGGMGGFEKWFAIKRIHPFLGKDEEFLHMFFDEARIAAALHHPNVVQVFDLGEADGQFFLAMEYLHGEPLNEVLKRAVQAGNLSPEVGAYIVARAAAGLHHAHIATDAHGSPLKIIHRDVSPQNIFVTYDGLVKVTDFGVAKAANRITHTATGLLKGKIAYAAPEQIMGEEIDHRTDIFALGVVLWETTTGRRLFRGKNDAETIMRISSGHRIPPSTVIEGYPDDLEWVINRALAQDRDARYADAGRLAHDIDRFLLEGGYKVGPAEVAKVMRELFPREIRRKERILSNRSGGRPSGASSRAAPKIPPGLFKLDMQGSRPAHARSAPPPPGAAALGHRLGHSQPRQEAIAVEPSYSQTRRRDPASGPPPGSIPPGPHSGAASFPSGGLALDGAGLGVDPSSAAWPPEEEEPSAGAQGIPPLAWIIPGGIAVIGLLIGVVIALWPSSSVVRVETVPGGAHILLDGQPTAEPAPTLLEDVEHGTHRLTLSLSGFHTEEASFEAAGDRVNLHYVLRPLEREPLPAAAAPSTEDGQPSQRAPEEGRARLRITSQPPATIYVDGQPVGRTPLLGYEVAAGRHQIRLVAGRRRRNVTINASSGETVIRSYRLR